MATRDWKGIDDLVNASYICGHCGLSTGSDRGYYKGTIKTGERIYICMRCEKPTYFDGDRQVPPAPYGNAVGSLPKTVEAVYTEARNCMLVGAHTAAALMCRKILMNVAHSQGAKEGLHFVDYIDFFDKSGYIPPNGKKWIDFIREKGNEATHEISQTARADAEHTITFVETILKLVFDFPSRI